MTYVIKSGDEPMGSTLELRSLLPMLRKSERRVLELTTWGGAAFDEAGLALGVSLTRIRQLCGEALCELKPGMKQLPGTGVENTITAQQPKFRTPSGL